MSNEEQNRVESKIQQREPIKLDEFINSCFDVESLFEIAKTNLDLISAYQNNEPHIKKAKKECIRFLDSNRVTLEQYLLVQIARLFDPEKTIQYENYSINRILTFMDNLEEPGMPNERREVLKDRAAKLLDRYKIIDFKTIRDKKMSHYDVSTIREGKKSILQFEDVKYLVEEGLSICRDILSYFGYSYSEGCQEDAYTKALHDLLTQDKR